MNYSRGCVRFAARLSRHITLFFSIWMLSSPLFGAPAWRRGGPEGGDIKTIAVDPTNSDIVYVGTNGGVWRSTDAGGHWSLVNKNLTTRSVKRVAVDPVETSTLYAATYDGVFRSTDSGASWQSSDQSFDISDVRAVAVDPHGKVYAGGLGKSTDRGVTWSKLNGGMALSVEQIIFDPQNPNTIYLAPLQKTTDGGATWSLISSGISGGPVTGLALTGSTLYATVYYKGLFRSTDGGANWVPVDTGSDAKDLFSVAIDPSNPNVIYVGRHMGRMMKSTDAGGNWQTVTCDPGPRIVSTLVVHQQRPGTVYAGTEGGFFVSTDGGQSWNPRNTGLTAQTISAIEVDDQNPKTFYVGTGTTGLWKTTDGGQTWASINPYGYPLKNATSVAKKKNSNLMYAAIDQGLYKSTDSGTTWERVGSGVLSYVTQVAISPVNSNLFVLATSFCISSDEGTTWVKKTSPVSQPGVMAIDPADPQTLYVGSVPRGMYKTTNGGDSWTRMSRIESLDAAYVDPSNSNVVYAAAGGDLLVSTDKGTKWFSPGSGLKHRFVRSFTPSHQGEVLAGTWEGWIFNTYNRGDSWSELQPRIRNGAPIMSVAVTSGTDAEVLAGTDGGGLLIGQYPEQRQLFFPQLADGTAGSLSFRSTIVLVNGGDDSQARIAFRDSNGQPLALKLNDSPAQSEHVVALKRLQSVSLRTPGTDPLKSGYAIVTSGPQVTGTVVFSRFDNGICMYEAGVPATPPLYDCSMLLDTSEPGRDIGLAVVNASDADAKVSIRLFDQSRREIASKEITQLKPNFGPGAHLALYSTEIFPEIKAQGITRGVVTLESDQPIAAVTLRQTDSSSTSYPAEVPTMCAFPVIPSRTELNPRTPANRTMFFPQIANGRAGSSQVKTSLVLLNPGHTSEAVWIEFHKANGEPLPLPLKNGSISSARSATVERGQTLELETTGEGGLQSGYATVSAPADFGGTAVFTFWQDGVRLFEAGVPSAVPTHSQCIYFDNSEGGRDVGLALANTSGVASDVIMKLYDNGGHLRSTLDLKTLDPVFEARDHLARYASELFPQIHEENIRGGIITVASTQPLSAVTLRQHSPSQSYPADFYLLTIFPVIAILP